jgi:phosphate starvation-inducible protein PhoH
MLLIINYLGNKEKVVSQFEHMNYLEAICNLLERLPQDIQEKIKESKNIEVEIKQYVQPEQYVAELEQVSTNALKELINSIIDIVTPQQKQKIENLLKTNTSSHLS